MCSCLKLWELLLPFLFWHHGSIYDRKNMVYIVQTHKQTQSDQNLTRFPCFHLFHCELIFYFVLFWGLLCHCVTKNNQCFFWSIRFIAFKHISCVPIQWLHPSGVAFEDQFLRLHPTWPTKDPTGDTRIHTPVKKLKSYLCSSKEVTMRR